MAGMFFTLEEVVEKLGKNKDHVQQLVDGGKLREFWDGSKQLFKVSDVESLLEISPGESGTVEIETAEAEFSVEPGNDITAMSESVLDFDDDIAALSETAGSDTLSMLVGDDTEKKADESDLAAEEGILESEEPGEALVEDSDSIEPVSGGLEESAISLEAEDTVGALDDSLDIFLDDEEPVEDVAPPEEATGEAVIEEDTFAAIEGNEESLKLQGTSISGESLPVLAGDESEAGILGDGDDDLDSAILPDDSMDFLLSDDTGLQSPSLESGEDDNLLSDETLSGLLGNSGEEAISGELSSIGKDEVSLGELTSADTSMGTAGINVLAESEGEFDLTGDGKSETRSPDSDDDDDDFDLNFDDAGDSTGLGDLDLDADINLDSLGSGSGLLDLSLQADDTSLGAVLDDILPAADEMDDMPEADSFGEGSVAEEADKIFEAAEPQSVMASGGGGAVAARYIEPEPTGTDNLFGGLLLVPFAILIYATVVLLLSFSDVKPKILMAISKDVSSLAMLWWVFFGVIALLGLTFGAAALAGRGSGETKVKTKKDKKTKKPKAAKKPKKKK